MRAGSVSVVPIHLEPQAVRTKITDSMKSQQVSGACASRRNAASNRASRSPLIRLGIFFSHPTQHHSILFQRLSEEESLDVVTHYYDPPQPHRDRDFGPQGSETWDIDLQGDSQCRILSNVLRYGRISPIRQLNPGVATAMRDGEFDAVILFGYVSPSNRIVMLLAKACGSKVLYQSDVNIMDEVRARRSKLQLRFRDSFLRRADQVLVIGDRNREAYRASGVDEEKMIWCPYPVDVSRFTAARESPSLQSQLARLRDKYSIPHSARVVAFSGKLIDRKRPMDLIEALRKLRRSDVYGIMIGSGPLEAELRSAIRANDHVRITGFVNQSVLPYHMLLADIGVITSDWDAHPLVATEFAACGIPVIASHYCGVWGDHDILRSGESGDIYECGDTTALAKAIDALLADENRRMRMGARAAELAQGQSVERAAAIIVNYLKATIQR